MFQSAGDVGNQTANQPVSLQGLKQLILKLRWAGLDQEADELCHVLEGMAPEDCVPQEPAETD